MAACKYARMDENFRAELVVDFSFGCLLLCHSLNENSTNNSFLNFSCTRVYFKISFKDKKKTLIFVKIQAAMRALGSFTLNP